MELKGVGFRGLGLSVRSGLYMKVHGTYYPLITLLITHV